MDQGRLKEVRKAEDRKRDSHGTRDEKQKLGSENKISYWFSLFSDTELEPQWGGGKLLSTLSTFLNAWQKSSSHRVKSQLGPLTKGAGRH